MTKEINRERKRETETFFSSWSSAEICISEVHLWEVGQGHSPDLVSRKRSLDWKSSIFNENGSCFLSASARWHTMFPDYEKGRKSAPASFISSRACERSLPLGTEGTLDSHRGAREQSGWRTKMTILTGRPALISDLKWSVASQLWLPGVAHGIGWLNNPLGLIEGVKFDWLDRFINQHGACGSTAPATPFLVSLAALISRDYFALHNAREKKLHKMQLVLCGYMSP